MTATITIPELKPNSKSEMFAIAKLDDGREIKFHLRKHSISANNEQWQTLLSEEDQVRLFSAILSRYRGRSIGDDNKYQAASIGVTEDNKIFIGINTMNQEEYFKDCAEQNMLNAATDQMVHQAAREGKEKPKKPPRLKTVYVMGGIDGGMQISCPCGKCTDMLAKVKPDHEDMNIYAIPISYDENASVVIRNGHDSTMSQVQRGEVWKATISKLNAYRDIDLRDIKEGHHVIAEQGRGLKRTLAQAKSKAKSGETDVASNAQVKGDIGVTLPQAVIMGAISRDMGKFFDASNHKLKELSRFGQVALQAAENIIFGRQSIPELDLDCKEKGKLPAINHFMVEHINEAVTNRLKSSGLSTDDPNWEKEFIAKIKAVRCCVVQLKDGSFHYAIEAQTQQDNASPNAEVLAMTTAMEKLTKERVQDVWVMEMRPEDIAKGHMHTSPKEGVERLVKRSSRVAEMTISYLPFNSGSWSDVVASGIQQFALKEIYPAAFRGAKITDGYLGTGRSG